MKIDDLKNDIKYLEQEAEELRQHLIEVFGEELPAEPKELSKGLRFATDSNLFNDTEREAINELDNLTIKVMRAIDQISVELSDIAKAQHKRENYESTLLEGTEIDYPAIYKNAEETLTLGEGISDSLKTMALQIQALACSRYFKKLKYRDIIKEVEAIADRIGVYDESGDYDKSQDYLEKFYSFLEAIKAVNLIGRFANDYYTLSLNAVIPTNYKDITAEKQRQYIRDLIEPCFSSHLEALKGMRQTTKEAEKTISEAIDRLFKSLNLTIEGGESAEIQHAKRNPVELYNYSQSQLSRELWHGNLKNNTKGRQLTIFDYTDENSPNKLEKKAVNAYLSASYKDLKGIIGLEDLTPEQEDIYNAIASEFKAGNQFVTARMIYKTMMGGDSTKKPSESKIAEIEQFIESATVTRITINNKEYAQATGKKKYATLTDNLLSMARLDEVEIDGKVLQSVYFIKDHPIANKYAEAIGQARDIPMRLLQTGTPQNFNTLRLYLLKELDYMKRDAKRRHKIKLETLYNNLYPKLTDRHKRQRIIENAEKMLRHWIKEGEIYSYEVEKEGKTPTAIRVYLTSQEKYTAEASLNRATALQTKKRGRNK